MGSAVILACSERSVQHKMSAADRSVPSNVNSYVLMSMLAYSATALAYLQADDYVHVRDMRIKLPQVRRENARPRPGRSC